MVPLPATLDPKAALVGWRIDAGDHAAAWDSGLGAQLYGGRWNPKGLRVVYCSLDPATCLVEVAVHRGFQVLDTQPHTLTRFEVTAADAVGVTMPGDVPDAAWLQGGLPTAAQQAWGAELLERHPLLLLPSAVSKPSWNLVFRPDRAQGLYRLDQQGPLVVDSRLNPAHRSRRTRRR